jgi:putative endonuclease
MHYVYILYSLKDHHLYKGYSEKPLERFQYHNAGGVRSTKHRRPLILLYSEKFDDKKAAQSYERHIKSLEGGSELRQKLMDLDLLDDGGRLKLS